MCFGIGMSTFDQSQKKLQLWIEENLNVVHLNEESLQTIIKPNHLRHVYLRQTRMLWMKEV